LRRRNVIASTAWPSASMGNFSTVAMFVTQPYHHSKNSLATNGKPPYTNAIVQQVYALG